MIDKLRKLIRKTMTEIARRKPGRKKLVYDKSTRTIVQVSRDGKREDTGISPHER